MTFLLDNDLPPRIAEILRIMGHDVHHLRERFPADALDVDWIPAAGREGWVIVTADTRIRRNAAERLALRQARTPAVFISAAVSDYPLHLKVSWFIKHWPDLEAAVSKARPMTVFDMQANGKVKEVCLPPRKRTKRTSQDRQSGDPSR